MSNSSSHRDVIHIWAARALIGPVLAWNVQCAVTFLARPQVYAPGFELSGAAGEAIVRGLGLLFLMWNVPYVVALLDPARHRVSLAEAIAMQALGFVGESLILWTLPGAHAAARATILRFILFDATGLVLLLAARALTKRSARPD